MPHPHLVANDAVLQSSFSTQFPVPDTKGGSLHHFYTYKYITKYHIKLLLLSFDLLATLKFEYTLSLCYVVKFQLFLGAAFIHNTNRRAQKCRDLSGNISKTSNLSPSALNKVEFWAPWVEMSPFLAKHCWDGGVGGWRDEPKANQKIVIRSRVLRNNITWKGFFTQSRVLLVSIVWNWFRVIKWTFCHLSIQRDGKTFALELSKCSTVVFSKIFFEHSWWSVCHTKELWTRCQECSPLTFSQWQKELKVIIWVQHLFHCVF